MFKIRLLMLSAFAVSGFILKAQETNLQSIDTVSEQFPDGFVRVEIRSSADNTIQPAIFYRSKALEKMPLIVSLHSWSNCYLNVDPHAKNIKEKDWNYIYPNFRGPNNRPEACGSLLVV